MKRAILVVAVAMMLICSGYAQDLVKVNVPFEFVAGKITLPAGTYEFRPTNDFSDMQVRNMDTGKVVVVPVITRLGTADSTPTRVTFDKVADKRILEAVMPGAVDGFLLRTTKEKHTHEVVKAG